MVKHALRILGFAWIIATVILQCGCHRDSTESPHAAQPLTAISNANAKSADAAVELSPSQLSAIKIEPVGIYAFSVEKEGMGNIDFDEDVALVQAESTLVSAAATFELSRKALARAQDLYTDGTGVAQKELEQAISDHQSAEGALQAARDAVRALGKTDAEIDRIIAARKIDSTNTALKWLVANVAESDLPAIKLGQPVVFTVAAYPARQFHGRVAKIYAIVDSATHRGKIRCDITDPNNELTPGMLANFAIRVQAPADAVAVPSDALVREGDGTITAWVTNDRHRFQQKIVKAGLRQNDRVQILEGLARNDLVVTEGAVFLSNLLQSPPTD